MTLHGRLRLRLLAGVAAVALGAPMTGKALAQEAKWQPWFELGGKIGTDRSLGDGDFFIPVWQDQTSLLFGDLRGRGDSRGTGEGNFGLGYRTQIDPEWIIGGWGYFDIQTSKYDNTFYQATLGAEALSVDWDVRVNGYIPFNSDGHSVDSKTELQVSGNTIQLKAGEEKSLFGFDGEVGWRLPVFPADGDMDVRAFVGGYYFANDQVETAAGPRGRIEARLYDIDVLGLQSRLTLDGEIQWDQVRGTQALGGLELRIPLGLVTGRSGPKLSPLDRRMVDRVQRDVDIVTQAGAFGGPEDVIVDGLSVKTHTIVFADAGGAGNGTKGSPIDLNAAPGLKPDKNAIIVVMGDDGPIGIANPLQLQAGQALIGGSSSVKLTGADSGQSVVFHAPGERPTLVGNDTGADLIEMASGSQNRITGLDLAGDFNNGILGADMERAVITDNGIDGADPGVGNGILIDNDGGAASSFVDITGNTIGNMSGNGILIVTALDGAAPAGGSAGALFSQQIEITDNTIGNVGANGIALSTTLYGARAVQAVAIAANSVASAGGNGIVVSNDLVPAGGDPVSLTQGLAIVGNVIGESGDNGIRVASHLNPGDVVGTEMALTQALVIAANTVTSSGLNGIYLQDRIAAEAGSGVGSVGFMQTVTIDANVIGGSGSDGIYVLDDVGSSLGPLAFGQALSIADNSITDAGRNGIKLMLIDRDEGGTLSQSIDLAGNMVSRVSESGISIRANLYDASAAQHIAIESNGITGATVNGIFVDADLVAEDSGSVSLDQGVSIVGNVIEDSGDAGIFVNANLGYGSSAIGTRTDFSQALAITANTITDSGLNGIFVFDNVFGAGQGDVGSMSLLQTAVIDDNVIGRPGFDGIYVFNVVFGGNSDNGSSLGPITFSQALAIDGNGIAGSGLDGIHVKNIVTRYGSDAASPLHFTQGVTVDANTVVGASGRGIEIAGYLAGAGLSGAVQAIGVAGNVVSGASGDGIALSTRLYGAGATQAIAISANSVADAGRDGIAVTNDLIAEGSDPVSLQQSLAITGNLIVDSVYGGIRVDSHLNPGDVVGTEMAFGQTLTIAANSVTSSGRNGISLRDDIAAPSGSGVGAVSVLQTAAIERNAVTGSGYNGIYVANNVGSSLGAVVFSQALSVDDNGIADAGRDGIGLVLTDHDAGATLSQSVGVTGNMVSDVSGTGISLRTNLYDASAAQEIAIEGNGITSAQGNGIFVDSLLTAADDSSVSLDQVVSITGNAIAGTTDHAIFVNDNLSPGTSATGTKMDLSQALAVTANTIIDGGLGGADGIFLFNNVFGPGQGDAGSMSFLQTAAIEGNVVGNSGVDGIYVLNVVSGGSSDNGSSLGPIAFSQALTIGGNSVTDSPQDGIHVANSVTRYGSDAVSPIHFTQSVAVGPNTILGAGGRGIEIGTYLGVAGMSDAVQQISIAGNLLSGISDDGIDVTTRLPSLGAASQAVTIVGNTISGPGHDGIQVSTSLGEANLTQALDILDNAVDGAAYNGILVGNQLSAPTGTFVLSQGGSVGGNRITSSGINGIVLLDRVASPADDATIGQTLAVVGNLIDGVTSSNESGGGNAILVQNYVGAFASLDQALAIQANALVNEASFRGIYIRTFVYGLSGHASQSFTIADNLASANGVDGVRVQAIALSAGSISQSVAITGNTLDHNADGAVGLFATAEGGASVAQSGSIAGNLLTNATAYLGQGIAGVAVAGQSGVVSQTIDVDGNMISGNAVGVFLKAGDQAEGDGGTVAQSWSFTSNSIVGSTVQAVGNPYLGGHGLYAFNAGSLSTQTVTLVSGNVITANQSDGVRFVNGAGTQSATLSSNLGGGPVLNTITSNGTDFFTSAAGGTQTITK